MYRLRYGYAHMYIYIYAFKNIYIGIHTYIHMRI